MANQASSQTNPITSAVLYPMQSPENGVIELLGSFQGNGASAPTVFRGGWFSAVTRVGAGHYRVQVNLSIPTLVVAGAPSGLIAEAICWVVSETITTQPVKFLVCQSSCYDVTTNVNTFDLYTYDTVGAAAYDLTTADRCFFRLAFKNTSITP